jgi:hypothetical protein
MDEQSRSNVDDVLVEFFPGRRNKRLDQELSRVEISYQKRVGAAKKRWDNAKHMQCTQTEEALQQQYASDSDSSSDSDLGSDLDLRVLNIGRLHPANAHRRESLLVLPNDQAAEIYAATQRHGEEAVIRGTRAYAEAVAKWPIEGRAHKVKGVARFFRDSDYMRDPREWEEGRTNGKQPVSAAAARSERSKQAIIDGLTAHARRGDPPIDVGLQVGAAKRISG